jgi:hypothetical protein
MANVHLRQFDWAGFVKAGTFENLALGVVGTGFFALVLLDSRIRLPDWMVVDVRVSAVCVVLGYLRVWKTAREEKETADLWASTDKTSDPYDSVVNRVFEFPYVFSISLLPLMAPLPQLFMLVLAVFYLVDNYYNSAMARGLSGASRDDGVTGTPAADGMAGERLAGRLKAAAPTKPAARNTWLDYVRALTQAMIRTVRIPSAQGGSRDADDLARYIWTRFRYNRGLAALLVIAVVWTVLSLAWAVALPLSAGTVAFGAVFAVLVVEALVEPHRNLGVTFTA